MTDRKLATDSLLSRIVTDPSVCHGKPCIRGHRIWVALVLDFLTSGASIDEMLQQYPDLERDDVLACIAYGAALSRVRFCDLEADMPAAVEYAIQAG